MPTPVICFGQQPCGIFPKRFLYAKTQTARKLQKEIGGKIVFFYHDSDADYRETITILEDLKTREEGRLNFTQENKIQKKYSPLYLKKIPVGWKGEILRKLPRFVGKKMIDIFADAIGDNAADFCLDMYKRMGLLEGIEVMRSSDKDFRAEASELSEFFADIPYEGEIVRAEMHEGSFRLHEGGGKYFTIPAPVKIEKWQKNPGRDERFAWMQSVIRGTHYISGAGEGAYLKKPDFPEVTFVDRQEIEKSEYAYIGEV
ncbi:MAG: hypothetical protein PHS53_02910 [Candidatus Pacebacteria bacterium]|nr:hypothetical protein [Candidatus Paceibacterota bacterium]MDD5357075.1 hypothetical protein [Candidatus Paceibacterota bacterium]